MTEVFSLIIIVLVALFSTDLKGQGNYSNDDKHECEQFKNISDWLDKFMPSYERAHARSQLAKYEQDINLTRQVEMLQSDNVTSNNEMINYAIEILTKHRDNLLRCNETVYQAVEGYWLTNCSTTVNRITHETTSTLSRIMKRTYSNITITKDNRSYHLHPELENIMSNSRDYQELLWAWLGWYDAVGPLVKDKFIRMVELANSGAQACGFNDASEVWKHRFVKDPDAEENMLKLWEEIKPLYKQLHAYVRSRLVEKYSPQVKGTSYETILNLEGPIPAHILGNMFSQDWSEIVDLLLPFPNALHPDVNGALTKLNYTAKKMFELAEEFFISLGFDPMTDIFWNKSVIERPADPNIVMNCHPLSYDMVAKDDFRIKMCTQITLSHLEVIHHEMGHIVYFMEYRKAQPFVYRKVDNLAFHEAIGDTIALSATSRSHLETTGLIEKLEGSSNYCKEFNDTNYLTANSSDSPMEIEINALMRKALQKLVFIPFAMSLELWRYGVFKGEIIPSNYNQKWWEIREKYQGIIPPLERNSSSFDPAAKYHIVADIDYARYFFGYIGQFQFHEVLCKEAGHSGPLHNCDIYGSKSAGDKLKEVLKEGSSKRWPVLMEMLTGQSNFSAHAILNYFKPLYDWLIIVNKNRKIGWENSRS